MENVAVQCTCVGNNDIPSDDLTLQNKTFALVCPSCQLFIGPDASFLILIPLLRNTSLNSQLNCEYLIIYTNQE